MELDTAVPYKLPFLCVISLNGGWTADPERTSPTAISATRATSKPIVVISIVDGSFSSLHLTAPAWHIDAVRGRPPHQILSTSSRAPVEREKRPAWAFAL